MNLKNLIPLMLFISCCMFSETKLLVLGSGTPNPDPERSGSAYAVVVNGKSYLVDFGPGVVRRASSFSPSWECTVTTLTAATFSNAHDRQTAYACTRQAPRRVVLDSSFTETADAVHVAACHRSAGKGITSPAKP